MPRKRFTNEQIAFALRQAVDNGPEFAGRMLDQWAYLNGVEIDFSRPGTRTDGRPKAPLFDQNKQRTTVEALNLAESSSRRRTLTAKLAVKVVRQGADTAKTNQAGTHVRVNAPLDSIASVLESTGDYRVLRRLAPLADCPEPPNEPTFIGLVLDVETTGTDFATDEVIELGILKFEYGASGRIYRVLETFNQLHQPQKPIPPEITRLTGITDADVAGWRIDDAAVQALAANAAVIIAHNASFDRQMCEGRWPVFAEKNWACSCHQVPWRAEGHEGMKLGYLLIDHGFFHEGHRAIDDCHALLRLLDSPLKTSGRLALSCLLETARRPTVRLWAQGSPIETKDLLKARRYRWSGARRCWYIDLEEDQIEIERSFLSEIVYRRPCGELPADRFTARDRFSARINPEF